MNFSNAIQTAKFAIGRGGLVLKKYSPEILTAAGVIGTVGSTVLACKATLKVEDILDEAKKKSNLINAVHDGEIEVDAEYTDKDYSKDLLVNRTQTAVKLIKLYGPAITLGALSITAILGGQHILRKRNVAVMAAYKLCEESFNNYRSRVKDELGEEKDRQFYYGITEETVKDKVKSKDGKTKTVTTKVEKAPDHLYSQYARFFDEANVNWNKSPEQNMYFLKMVQNQMNDKLKARGHVFLNEVYDALGFDRSEAGQLVGWVWNKDNTAMEAGDGYIDFGIFDGNSYAKRAFVNGDERSILLDFNIDGMIYDLI
nr:MAG TPA: hypothetical protein [Caudoviricetes sp.]